MLQELSNLVVADNTGAKRAMCFRILKQRKEYAHLGDVIRVAIKEASPTSSVKKGSVATAVIIRTATRLLPVISPSRSTVFFICKSPLPVILACSMFYRCGASL